LGLKLFFHIRIKNIKDKENYIMPTLQNKILILSAVLGISQLLISCGEKEKPVEQIRSIKTITISNQTSGQLRKFSAVVYAVNYAFLEFKDVSGKVIKLNVGIGDKVSKGDILAVLDKEKYQLDVKDGEANLKKSIAQLSKAKTDYDREKILLKKDESSQTSLDTKKMQYEAAVSGKKFAETALGLANRNLNHTELKSPYDGYISERFIQPNQEIKVGTNIFRIDENGDMEVQFDIPEDLRKRVKLDSEGGVRLSGHPEVTIKSNISYISNAATKGNVFQVKSLLKNIPKYLKPGMTAEISLLLPMKGDKSGFLIPLTAVLMGDNKKMGDVFVYNPKTSTVTKTKVHFKGFQGDLCIVADGIKSGDIIATTGVAFLLDGMKVNLFKAKTESGKKL
jgi:membrane fusion protein, multidrug efflux system